MSEQEMLDALDDGIREQVRILRAGGIETFESCQGGDGHAYPEPTVRFSGERLQGFRALAIAHENGLRVSAMRRTWPIIDGDPVGPYWEMTFVPTIESLSPQREGKGQVTLTAGYCSTCGHLAPYEHLMATANWECADCADRRNKTPNPTTPPPPAEKGPDSNDAD